MAGFPLKFSRSPRRSRLRSAWERTTTTRARLGAAGIDVSEVRTGRKPGTRVATVRNGTCGVPTLLVQPMARA
jgi:hypothetical protein